MTTTSAPRGEAVTEAAAKSGNPDHYKWIALSNTTIGILMVTISGSITIISLPDIFRGIKLNPLASGNTSYLLWLLMGFLLVTAVLVVSFGRIGDMYGRVRMYNIGFAVFTFFSILLSVTWMTGAAGALWLIIMRIFQGVGGAFLFANSSAILTDAFPENERGLALGINSVAAIAGSFLGLLIGGLLSPINWRLVFLVSVPFGLFGTVWAYLKLVDTGKRSAARIDWAGNITFAIGLIALLTGIVYSIQPYGGHTMGWTNPGVLAAIGGGILTLITFGVIETKSPDPMFRLHLFKIRAFTAGNIANLLGALGRGGLQFILIIWLQGIWLPQHGYNFERTPLWAGIYMIPLTVGFLVAGPISGILSDKYGARPFATGGMIGAAVAFVLLELLPINFGYVWFGLILLLMGLSMGVFGSPNRAAVMNSLPPDQRGAGAGMMTTFQNAATVLSIGVFFTVIIIGLSATLPSHLYSGLVANGVPATAAHKVANLPPISSLFSALLGYNPIQQLLGPSVLNHVSAAQAAHLTGRSFFPQLISSPFGTGLHYAFDFAIVASLIAAVASYLRGGKYIHGQDAEPSLASSGTGVEVASAPSLHPYSSDEGRVLESVGAHSPAGAMSTNGASRNGWAHDTAPSTNGALSHRPSANGSASPSSSDAPPSATSSGGVSKAEPPVPAVVTGPAAGDVAPAVAPTPEKGAVLPEDTSEVSITLSFRLTRHRD